MSFVECNPNHCPSIKSMGESLIKQELKIKELEQQNKELKEVITQIMRNVCTYCPFCGEPTGLIQKE